MTLEDQGHKCASSGSSRRTRLFDLVKLSDNRFYDLCRQGKLVGATRIGARWRAEKQLLARLEAGGNLEHADEEHDPRDG